MELLFYVKSEIMLVSFGETHLKPSATAWSKGFVNLKSTKFKLRQHIPIVNSVSYLTKYSIIITGRANGVNRRFRLLWR